MRSAPKISGDSSPTALKRSAVQAHFRGRSPDSQVDASPDTFPFLKRNSGYAEPARSLLTVARPCGIFTRFPFHSPAGARTSEQFYYYHTKSNQSRRYRRDEGK